MKSQSWFSNRCCCYYCSYLKLDKFGLSHKSQEHIKGRIFPLENQVLQKLCPWVFIPNALKLSHSVCLEGKMDPYCKPGLLLQFVTQSARYLKWLWHFYPLIKLFPRIWDKQMFLLSLQNVLQSISYLFGVNCQKTKVSAGTRVLEVQRVKHSTFIFKKKCPQLILCLSNIY